MALFPSIRKPYQALLVVTLVLIAYFPVSFGDFCSVDDVGMMSSLASSESFRMHDVFVPAAAEGLYYRPIILLSFLVDRHVFHLEPRFMHLENIMLHALNSLLVFWLAYQLLAGNRRRDNYLPLVSALLFGIHPIATESVSWISGRTDVLTSAFLLLSANFLLLFKSRHLYRYVVCSLVFMFLGFLTKETALLFLPGFFLLMSAKGNETEEEASNGKSGSGLPRGTALIIFAGLAAIIGFFLLRSAAIMTNRGSIHYTIQAIMLDPVYSSMVVLETFAFYLKKIFLPLPLNFAIIETDPLYELIALPLVIACLGILSRRTPRSALFMSGIFLIAPAFLPAFGQLAWTAYAERYIYIPAAFITPAAVLYLGESIQRDQIHVQGRAAAVIAIVLIVAGSVFTFQRSLVWMSNLSLFKDTVAKSPTFYVARAEYGRALALSGHFQEALIQFKQAKREDARKVANGSYVKASFHSGRFGYWPNPDLGIAYILVQEGKIEEAAELYETIYSYLPERGEQTNMVLSSIVSLYAELLSRSRSSRGDLKYQKKVSFYAQKLYSMKRSPVVFFQVGKVLFLRGDKGMALSYFKKAFELLPEEDAYKAIAEKYVKMRI